MLSASALTESPPSLPAQFGSLPFSLPFSRCIVPRCVSRQQAGAYKPGHGCLACKLLSCQAMWMGSQMCVNSLRKPACMLRPAAAACNLDVSEWKIYLAMKPFQQACLYEHAKAGLKTTLNTPEEPFAAPRQPHLLDQGPELDLLEPQALLPMKFGLHLHASILQLQSHQQVVTSWMDVI